MTAGEWTLPTGRDLVGLEEMLDYEADQRRGEKAKSLPCGHPVTGYRQVRYVCNINCPGTHLSARCEVCGPYPDNLGHILSEPLTPAARTEKARLRRNERAAALRARQAGEVEA